MAGNSTLRRLAKLEVKQRFLDWFAKQRFYHTLTQHELMTFALNGQLPHPIPERPSTMDGLDRKSLHLLWKEHERTFGGRSQEELAFFARNGFWPEQRGRFHYSMHDGNLIIEWLIGAESEEPIDFGGNQ